MNSNHGYNLLYTIDSVFFAFCGMLYFQYIHISLEEMTKQKMLLKSQVEMYFCFVVENIDVLQ